MYYTQAVYEGSFTLMNTEVPMYSLKENTKAYVPPMSEEIDVYSGKLYIASELCSMFFKGFVHVWGGESCWSLQN